MGENLLPFGDEMKPAPLSVRLRASISELLFPDCFKIKISDMATELAVRILRNLQRGHRCVRGVYGP